MYKEKLDNDIKDEKLTKVEYIMIKEDQVY